MRKSAEHIAFATTSGDSCMSRDCTMVGSAWGRMIHAKNYSKSMGVQFSLEVYRISNSLFISKTLCPNVGNDNTSMMICVASLHMT